MKLTSERLVYSRLTEADSPLYLTMATNADVMKYITGKALNNDEAAERLKSMVDINKENKQAGFYKINEKDSAAFIGLGKLVCVRNHTAEIGYSLLPQYWGKRYASEIAGFFIRYACGLPYIQELIAIVNPENTASKKLLGNHGFTWFETGFLNEQPAEIYNLVLKK
jgi:[ribosomal protein S5]-alanine N-acetyltransferase